jgi:hypothetical protein
LSAADGTPVPARCHPPHVDTCSFASLPSHTHVSSGCYNCNHPCPTLTQEMKTNSSPAPLCRFSQLQVLSTAQQDCGDPRIGTNALLQTLTAAWQLRTPQQPITNPTAPLTAAWQLQNPPLSRSIESCRCTPWPQTVAPQSARPAPGTAGGTFQLGSSRHTAPQSSPPCAPTTCRHPVGGGQQRRQQQQ